jgi:hypothetical protein
MPQLVLSEFVIVELGAVPMFDSPPLPAAAGI